MNAFFRKLKSSGPAAIITSAFIGPGTIIVSTKVGISFGFSLLWATVFAVISLILLMETASRIAIVTRKDLVEAIIDVFPGNQLWKRFIQVLMLLAVLTICFAFQTGNLTGGALGFADIFGIGTTPVVLGMTAVVLAVTLLGSTKSLEFIMKLFVGVMGFIFIFTMLVVKPDPAAMAAGLVPQLPPGSYVLTLALVGTTLIGINLILHSITSKARWSKVEDLADAKWDIGFNILIGGLITISLVVTAATVLRGSPIAGHPALAFTRSLEPVLGSYARVLGDLGLFAAGLSSAIAIPFTLKNITTSVFRFSDGVHGKKANAIAVVAILFGAFLFITGKNPLEIIITAQAVSGFFLPLITVLILIVANNKKLLGQYTNNMFQNLIGILVVVLTVLLGANGIIQAFNSLMKLLGG